MNQFLGTDYTFEGSRTIVLPVPYEGTVSYWPGTRFGPQAIINSSLHLEEFDEELGTSASRLGIFTLPPLEPRMSGPSNMIQEVERNVGYILKERKFPVILGGEHSITLGAVSAFHKTTSKLQVLYLDAHADLRDVYQGARVSHACVARRIAELPVEVFHVGLRSLSMEEHRFIDENGLNPLPARLIKRDSSYCSSLIEGIHHKVYLTVDLDVFDPSVMPAVGTPEPGGLSWEEVAGFMREVTRRCTVVGMDVVELCPIPGMIAPDFTAAKLIYKILGYVFEGETERLKLSEPGLFTTEVAETAEINKK